MTTFLTLGGRVQCRQCNATSKRTKQQCRAPAIRGKTKCRFHGGRSTGPRTPEGKARVAAAHTIHGRETRQKRLETSYALAELHHLEEVGHNCGLFPEGAGRTRGRKPRGVSVASQKLAYLNDLVKEERKEAILEELRAIVYG
jgi:hypothetical protein